MLSFTWTVEHDSIFEEEPNDSNVQSLIKYRFPDRLFPSLREVKERRKYLQGFTLMYNRYKEWAINPRQDKYLVIDRHLFKESFNYLLGTMPDKRLAKMFNMSLESSEELRKEKGILSYEQTRSDPYHSCTGYDKQREDRMYEKVRKIALTYPEDRYEKACELLYPTNPYWIHQCLQKFEIKEKQECQSTEPQSSNGNGNTMS